MEKEKLMNMVEELNVRGAWKNGVKAYAYDLVESLQVDNVNIDDLKSELLNGADNWKEYSWGGNAFIFDGDIAERLCTPSEMKKTDNGDKQPNSRETWLDVQARALSQAFTLIKKLVRDELEK